MTTAIAEIPLHSAPKPKSKRPLLPLTLDKREEKGSVLCVPASVEEFIEYLNKCDYTLQYSRGCIWSFIEIDEKTGIIMGQAAPIHEQIVSKFTALLNKLFDDFDGEFRPFSSNLKVYIQRDNSYYNPDITITKGTPTFVRHKFNKKSADSLTNPYLIVEVLSKSTESFDKMNKLPDYKKIESLEQIIFIEPNKTWVSTFIRQDADRWLNLIFENNTDKLPITDRGHIILNDIYKNLFRFNVSDLKTI